MPITFEKLFRGEYRATLGQFSECGKTKSAAQDALLATLEAIPSNTDAAVEIDCHGNTWVLWFTGRCWAYRIGAKTVSVFLSTTTDRHKAMASMRDHMLQHAMDNVTGA